ncbi:MAG: glycosyltransferase family 4 protein [Opitutales bacterium]|nr:glycosyltransferase family 4 protein [Opitutales bacterium]NRA26754.1 glycosyltransferase family 4 protein [Opitutales bacterium]
MNIAVVNTAVPFTRGGAEIHADHLVTALNNAGHRAELVTIPFNWRTPWSIADHLMAVRLMDIEYVNGISVDRVIGLRFPAYHIRHPNKVLWVIHQYRSAFDTWKHLNADLASQQGGAALRNYISDEESELLNKSAAVFTNSRNVSERMKRYCNFEAPPLYHPPGLADLLSPGEAEPFFLVPGRVERLKRPDLIVSALEKTQKPVQLVFAGQLDNSPNGKAIQKTIKRSSARDRIQLLGYVRNTVLVDLYKRTRAVVYCPYDEDYGYVPLEAMLSQKPVITTKDSGGCTEFVSGDNGWVCEPEVAAIAQAMDIAWESPLDCKKRGENGYAFYQSLNISWEHVVQTLMQ